MNTQISAGRRAQIYIYRNWILLVWPTTAEEQWDTQTLRYSFQESSNLNFIGKIGCSNNISLFLAEASPQWEKLERPYIFSFRYYTYYGDHTDTMINRQMTCNCTGDFCNLKVRKIYFAKYTAPITTIPTTIGPMNSIEVAERFIMLVVQQMVLIQLECFHQIRLWKQLHH